MINKLKVPDYWETIKLKFVSKVSFSSVDRHNGDDYLPVRICHYPDAYKNEKIDSQTRISSGYCSQKQLDDFALTDGRLVITKDSETADDIGVPVLINETIENGVVGYHLAIIDVYREKYDSAFLLRVVQSKYVRVEFELSSNGVTRFGLGKPAIENLEIPLPPLPEQTKIANYLDHKTSIIDKLIADKERLVELLQEQRQATINEAVTGGLDADGNIRQKPASLPAAGWKDSGIEWLGAVPEDWEVVPLRYLGETQNGVSKGGEYFGQGDPFVSYSDVYKNMDLNHDLSGLAQSTPEDKITYSVMEGDVFFTRTSETILEIGMSSVCMNTIDDAVFAGFLIRFRPYDKRLLKGFSKFYFRSFISRIFFTKEMNLVTRASLSQDLLKRTPVLLPKKGEQESLIKYLEFREKENTILNQNLKSQIQNLKSYRQSLISEAVTGKIDLREWEEVEV